MCLSKCGSYFITGDLQGLIYVWTTDTSIATANAGLISTYELLKDKGEITNLVPLFRPLSLFGLTANMKQYEVTQARPLQKY